MTGVIDVLDDTQLVCTSTDVVGRQVYAVVIKYIEDNPDKWNQDASFLVSAPLSKPFLVTNKYP